MLRDILSYLVLILVPVVSLVIAIVPYVIVKRRHADQRGQERGSTRKEELYTSSNAVSAPKEAEPYGSLRGMPLRPWVSTPHLTAKLWLALLIGLVGNVGWWWFFDLLITAKTSYYLFGTNDSGIMFGFILYSLFIITTPFIFYKIKHGKFTGKAIIYNILISLLVAGLVLGVWIVLAIIAYRGLYYQLN